MKIKSVVSFLAVFVFLSGTFVVQSSAQLSTKSAEKIKSMRAKPPVKVESLPPAPELSSGIVISQVNGGGGGSTGTYLFDYVELKNNSGSPKSLNGMAIYYGSGTGNFASTASNGFALPNVTIQPGKYFLVQTGPTGSTGMALPTPDAITGNLTMSATAGKVALVAGLPINNCGATANPCALPHFSIVDLVAWGTANNAEGGAATNGGANTTSTQGNVRKNSGCTDTDNNNADFDVLTAPVPRNSSSAAFLCGVATNTRTPLDFDGDGRTDYVVARETFHEGGGFAVWHISLNSSTTTYSQEWGLVATDDFAYADYDGDGKTDIGAWRRGALSTFYIIESSTNTIQINQLGLLDDEVVSGDYNGDGKADIAVFRNNLDGTSGWHYRPSFTSNYVTITLDGQGSRAEGDYDGDGMIDPAIFTSGTGGAGHLRAKLSSGGMLTFDFGLATDFVAPGDYDGDGRTDLCVLRVDGPLIRWDYEPSGTAGVTVVTDTWGLIATDIPAPGDYNGDGRIDYGIWRDIALAEFWVMTSGARLGMVRQWGLAGDFPAAASRVSNGF